MSARQPAPATMEQLLESVLQDRELPLTKRRNLASSVRKFVDHLGLGLHMAADFPTYRRHIARFDPARAGIGAKRWANIRSDLSFALTRYGARTRAPLPKDLTAEWRRHRDLLTDIRLVRGLSRLMHWCSRSDIASDGVNDAVMERFQRHLHDETFETRPDRVYRRTCVLWNRAATEVAGWPDAQVNVPNFRNLVSLPLSEFLASFQADLERYGQRLSGQDLTANDLPDKPLKPATIRGHLYQFQRFASAMVRAGRPIGEITDLGCLVELDWFRRAMQAEFERLGGARPSLSELAYTLVKLAEHDVRVPKWQLEELKQVKRRLKCPRRGFTEKNRERLRPFTDERNQARFLYLADRLLKLARKRVVDKKAALLVQTALTHAILLEAPMRFGNLTQLDLFRHFEGSRRGRKVGIRIDIPANEVKNNEPLTFMLSPQTADLLELYRKQYRPLLLAGPEEGWLFPGAKHGYKTQVGLGEQLCKAVQKHVGLTVNPHLYRHIAAYFYLSAHPGEFETVRRVLGHKSIETTVTFYADFDRLFAMRRYGEHILERRLKVAPDDGARP